MAALALGMLPLSLTGGNNDSPVRSSKRPSRGSPDLGMPAPTRTSAAKLRGRQSCVPVAGSASRAADAVDADPSCGDAQL